MGSIGVHSGYLRGGFAYHGGGGDDIFFAPGFQTVIDSDSLRAVVVLLFTVMPNNEPLMKLAFVNWYMLFFLGLITLFTLPQRSLARWLLFFLAVVASWSTPAAMVCLPLFLLRAWEAADRGERIWWVALALVAAGYPLTAERQGSLIAMLLHERDWLTVLVRGTGYRVFCFFLAGEMSCYPLNFEGWKSVTIFSSLLVGILPGERCWQLSKLKYQERGPADTDGSAVFNTEFVRHVCCCARSGGNFS